MPEPFSQKFRRINWETFSKRLMFWTKVVLIIILLISSFSNSVIGWAVQQVEVPCIEDIGFSFLSSLNLTFHSNSSNLAALITTTSLICDFLFVCFAIRQLFWSQSFKTTIGLMMVYSMHVIVRQLFWLRVPEGRCWEDPWVPSLIFTFHESPDFFYSTSTAAVFLFATENKEVKNWILFALALLAFCLVSIMTMATRMDYTVSILTGVMIGHYSWIVAGYAENKISELGVFKETKFD
jgi:hypothetical protein